MEMRGRPTVVLTTTQFVNLTNRVVANFGMPGARVLVVNHPLGGTDTETIRSWADGAVDRTLALFTAAS
jgi:hypothetical protein